MCLQPSAALGLKLSKKKKKGNFLLTLKVMQQPDGSESSIDYEVVQQLKSCKGKVELRHKLLAAIPLSLFGLPEFGTIKHLDVGKNNLSALPKVHLSSILSQSFSSVA